MQNYASAEEKGYMVLMDPGQKNRGLRYWEPVGYGVNLPEHGQGDSQPHSHVVAGDDSQVIDDDKVHPSLGVLVPVQRLRDDVEIHSVHEVDRHCHHVGDGQCRQDAVGRGNHVSPRQDDDVDDVGDDAEQTDDGADVAMVFHVVTIKL